MNWSTVSILAYLAEAAYDHGRDSLDRRSFNPATTPDFAADHGRPPPDWLVLTSSDLGLPSIGPFDGFFRFSLLLPPIDIQAFVAYNPTTKQVALSIRGTEEYYLDLQTDLDLPFTAGVLAALLQPLAVLAKAFAEGAGCELLVTGHSLGAAIAERLAAGAPDMFDGGAFFAAPATLTLSPSLDPSEFIGITHSTDPVGMFPSGAHSAAQLVFDDYEFSSFLDRPFSGAHSMERYAFHVRAINLSPIGDDLPLNAGTVAFLATYDNNSIAVGQPIPTTFFRTRGMDHVVFGGLVHDTIGVANGEASDFWLWAEGLGGSDTLLGGQGADRLSGGDGNDFVTGNGGADNLWGGSGLDYLSGGEGGDTYHIRLAQDPDTIDDRGSTGEDVLRIYTDGSLSAFNFEWFTVETSDLLVRIPGNVGYLLEVRIKDMGARSGGIERVELWSSDGSHQITEAWDLTDVWERRTQSATPSQPTIIQGSSAPAPTPSGIGSSTQSATSGDNVLIGGPGDDILRGLGGNDAIGGNDGDDKLLGNAGNDIINGGDDDDLLVDDDSSNGRGADYLDGGSGDDSLVFYGAPSGGRDFGDGGSGSDLALVDLSGRTQDWRLSENDGDITLRLNSGSGEGEIDLENIETIAVLFGSGDDSANTGDRRAYLVGAAGDDHLTSGRGNDYLEGGDGDDNLDGGAGVDWIDGGAGDDYAEIDLSGESQDLTYRASRAAEAGGFTFANGTHVRNVERVDLVTGSGDDRIWLGDGDDRVQTRGGDDVITSELTGRDTVDGGNGNDRLVVDLSNGSARLRSSFSGSDGHFEIYSGTQYASAARRVHVVNVEDVVLRGGSAGDSLRGGRGDDELIGNAGDDSINGGDGDDYMNGGAGDDDLFLDSGVDWADGGEGDDYGSLDRSGSAINFDFDMRAVASQAGQTLADGSFARNIERWDILLGSGDDVVTAYLNTSRTISLGAGDNRLVIDHRLESDILYAMPGGGPFFISAGSDYATAVDRIFVTGANTLTIYGGAAADSLTGLAGADIIVGGAGDDLLNGADGADSLDGGLGSDTLFGGAGADILRDGGETTNRDFLYGGAGNDTYYVTSSFTGPTDLVYEGAAVAGAEGGVGDIDVIHSNGEFFWDFYGVAEELYIDRAAGSQMVGGTNDQKFFGNTGTDVMLVYGGSNRIDAGAGTDVIGLSLYGLDESYDGVNTVVMKAGSGIDYVYDFESGVDKIDLTAFNFGITGQQVLDQAVNVDLAGTADDHVYFYLTSAGGVDNFIVFMGLQSSQLSASDFVTGTA